MELGISGRNATLVRSEGRFCKSCLSFTRHLMYEELDINFSVCLPCVALYVSNMDRAELAAFIRDLVSGRG